MPLPHPTPPPKADWLVQIGSLAGFLAAMGIGGIFLIMAALSAGLFLIRQEVKPATTTPGQPAAQAVITDTPTPSPSLATLPGLMILTPTATPMITETPTASPIPDNPPTAAPDDSSDVSDCPHPDGWELHRVEPGETLFAFVLGAGGTVTTDDLRQANCLSSDLLQIGQALYLPPGAAENAPPSEPIAPAGSAGTGPRTPNCDPHCTISIRPGWRAEQIAAVIDAVPVAFWGADFLAAIGPGAATPTYEFLASRPPGQSLEGYLYPGTYELSNDTGPADFRDMLLAAFAANLPGDAYAAAGAQGLTFYQALTLASIIQRESWSYSEQVLISSVFHNRLRAGMPLGSTVTTQYALGSPGNWWPRIRGDQINTASPYNTNLNAGLPPSPISNPGVEAINAALHPANTDYLFFTGNCLGSGNVYAATYEEHLANVNACQ